MCRNLRRLSRRCSYRACYKRSRLRKSLQDLGVYRLIRLNHRVKKHVRLVLLARDLCQIAPMSTTIRCQASG